MSFSSFEQSTPGAYKRNRDCSLTSLLTGECLDYKDGLQPVQSTQEPQLDFGGVALTEKLRLSSVYQNNPLFDPFCQAEEMSLASLAEGDLDPISSLCPAYMDLQKKCEEARRARKRRQDGVETVSEERRKQLFKDSQNFLAAQMAAAGLVPEEEPSQEMAYNQTPQQYQQQPQYYQQPQYQPQYTQNQFNPQHQQAVMSPTQQLANNGFTSEQLANNGYDPAFLQQVLDSLNNSQQFINRAQSAKGVA